MSSSNQPPPVAPRALPPLASPKGPAPLPYAAWFTYGLGLPGLTSLLVATVIVFTSWGSSFALEKRLANTGLAAVFGGCPGLLASLVANHFLVPHTLSARYEAYLRGLFYGFLFVLVPSWLATVFLGLANSIP